MTQDPDCEKCEELLQAYLDRDLTAEGLLAKLAQLRGPTADGL